MKICFLCRGPAKLEDAADLYVKAGNGYKIAKKYLGEERARERVGGS